MVTNKNTTSQRKKTDKTTHDDSDAALTEQLSRAQAAVERNFVATQTLHRQWKTQLLRMSYLVMVVTLHMAQSPSSACIKDIKQFNAEYPEYTVPGIRAIGVVLYDSVVEILSILCAAFIVWCLGLPETQTNEQPASSSSSSLELFSSLPYRLSCGTLPMIISLYFQKKQLLDAKSGGDDDDPAAASCIQNMVETLENITSFVSKQQQEELPEKTTRHFPVILVFHTIVSISIWFMQYQTRQHVKNLQLVQKLQKDLAQATNNNNHTNSRSKKTKDT